MNQKLVESLAQIILSLSEEERQLLENKVQKLSVSQQVTDLAHRLKSFEEKYHIPSELFYQQFQSGELGDSPDFFEWNTYYEMQNAAQVKAA
jgi:predicted nuclease with TOPRIM domain